VIKRTKLCQLAQEYKTLSIQQNFFINIREILIECKGIFRWKNESNMLVKSWNGRKLYWSNAYSICNWWSNVYSAFIFSKLLKIRHLWHLKIVTLPALISNRRYSIVKEIKYIIFSYRWYLWNENKRVSQNLYYNWLAENGCQGFYIKWKEGGREQDSWETERERECVCMHQLTAASESVKETHL
jgi:hypothetical protein